MPDVGYLRPGGDPAANDLAQWGDRLRSRLESSGHPTGFDLQLNGCDRASCDGVLSAPVPLVFFFGHGSDVALLGFLGEAVIDDENLALAASKTLVSIACEGGRHVGSAAVQAGVRTHLGWNVLLLWLARDADTYGQALVDALSVLGKTGSAAETADALTEALNGIALRYRPLMHHEPNAKLAYYAAAAAAGQVVIHGDRGVRPLAHGLASIASGLLWRGVRLTRSSVAKLKGG